MHTELFDKLEFKLAKNCIDRAKNIVIISHRNPDADAIGANLALRAVLEKIGKNIVSACCHEVPKNLLFLENTDKFVKDFDPKNFDLVISVDCGSLDQVQFKEHIHYFKLNDVPFINIDHHISNNSFATVNIVETDLASTCEILYYFFKFADFEIDQFVANCLLLGLYYDTGSFKHSNTSSSNLSISAELIEKGADFEAIVRNLFKTNPLEQLKLWGMIWNRARINDRGIVISALLKEDFEACNASKEQVGGAIDYMNSVADSKFCMILTQDGDDVKASVRTQRDDVNLSLLSQIFGGGGHEKASGFNLTGKIKKDIEINWHLGV